MFYCMLLVCVKRIYNSQLKYLSLDCFWLEVLSCPNFRGHSWAQLQITGRYTFYLFLKGNHSTPSSTGKHQPAKSIHLCVSNRSYNRFIFQISEMKWCFNRPCRFKTTYTKICTPCWVSNEGDLPLGIGAQTRTLWTFKPGNHGKVPLQDTNSSI